MWFDQPVLRRTTHTPLPDSADAWFAGAFLTFGVNWALLAWNHAGEHASYVYAVRLLGFLQILIAIAVKNRRKPD